VRESLRRKILIQCDFDGTVTEEDVSFALLDTFADGDWRSLLEEYKQGKMSVGAFNSQAFSMIRADKSELVETSLKRGKVRPGFAEFVEFCRAGGMRFVIVSNGLDFYIDEILRTLKLEDVEVFASRTGFNSGRIEVEYVGPDGRTLNDGFKEAYTRHFVDRGYEVIYIGDGFSDIFPARHCRHVFATRELPARCKTMDLPCTPFVDFHEVRRGIDSLLAGNTL
jgi:2-hydroxy-3-keto-5-methylthiopentenyl-1-phosphate phosphatase